MVMLILTLWNFHAVYCLNDLNGIFYTLRYSFKAFSIQVQNADFAFIFLNFFPLFSLDLW